MRFFAIVLLLILPAGTCSSAPAMEEHLAEQPSLDEIGCAVDEVEG